MAMMIITGLLAHPLYRTPRERDSVVMLSMGVRIVGTALIFVLLRRQESVAVVPVMLLHWLCVATYIDRGGVDLASFRA